MGARRRALRPVGRLAVLVLRGGDRLPRPAAARRRPGHAAVLQLRALRRRAGAPRGVPPLRARRHASRATPPRTARRCTSSGTTSREVVTSRAGRRAYRVEARRGDRARDAARGALPRRRGGARAAAGDGLMTRTILALGGGGFTTPPGDPALDELVLELTGRREPRILLPADGQRRRRRADAPLPRRVHATAPCQPKVLSLFRLREQRRPLRDLILAQDAIYVGGGSMRNLVALWREHGVDELLHEAWERGIVLAGLSAGAMCWFEQGADALGRRAAPAAGLGFLRGSFSVHRDTEPERRPAFLEAVEAGAMPPRLGGRRRRRDRLPRPGTSRASSARARAPASRASSSSTAWPSSASSRSSGSALPARASSRTPPCASCAPCAACARAASARGTDAVAGYSPCSVASSVRAPPRSRCSQR